MELGHLSTMKFFEGSAIQRHDCNFTDWFRFLWSWYEDAPLPLQTA